MVNPKFYFGISIFEAVNPTVFLW